MTDNGKPPSFSPLSGSLRIKQVVVLTTAMLTFIPFWKAAAIVLCDFGSSAFYAGGIAMQAFGPAFPWFILAAMLFSGAMLAVYTESCSMFVRGGVYKVVKEGLGDTMAKFSVSALMFDYVLTGPISAVTAGHYLAGLFNSTLHYFNFAFTIHPASFAVVFALLVTLYFWRQNVRGIEESSDDSAKIVFYAIFIGIVLVLWGLLTIWQRGFHLPSFQLQFNAESLGWASGVDWLAPIGMLGVIMAFGHSVLAMSGLETIAQVYREMESPKMENLKKTALVVFLFALLFTGGLTFVAALIIPPDVVASKYASNLLAGLSMELAGPMWLRLFMQALVVVSGVMMLAGAVNTALVGSNGVLNRVAEDGILAEWFRHLHPRYGTTNRIVNLVAIIQLVIIVLCRGDVYLLGEAYAFGLLWSFVFMALSLAMLRFKDTTKREWMVPFNIKYENFQVPLGIFAILVLLLIVAGTNLITKKVATMSGLVFTSIFYVIFTVSERMNEKKRRQISEHREQLNTEQAFDMNTAIASLEKEDRILVAVRNPNNLYHLNKILETVDDSKTEVIVMCSKVAKGIQLSGENAEVGHDEIALFTSVILAAEKHGQKVTPIMVLSNDPFYAICQTALTARARQIVMGVSGAYGADSQLERLAMAWGALKVQQQVDSPVLARVIWEGREMSFELT